MSDLEIFKHSIEELTLHLKDCCTFDGKTIIVAVSRKGPRLLERILADISIANDPLVITEHALPFFFRDLARCEYSKVQILLVDDAVYFGSTIEGIYREILAYKDYYHLSFDLKVFTAIKTEDSKNLAELDIHAENVRKGYGHYFVKHIMAELRSSHKPLEIDFPCIAYRMEKTIDTEALNKELGLLYHGMVYRVSHAECESYNVVMKPDSGAFFNKLRIYPDGNYLYIEPMSPRVIINEEDQLIHLLDDAAEDICDYWHELCTRYLAKDDGYPSQLQQPITKAFVTIANYLYSINTLIKEEMTLQPAFDKAGGLICDISIKGCDLCYLLSDNELTKRLYGIIENHLCKRLPLFYTYGINLIKFSEQQVFESYDYPTKEEKEVLKNHDSHMIFNSKNIPQALSAIFFNQNLLIERGSRKNCKLGRSRLNFGYTFHSLKKLISDYRNEFSFNETDMLLVHKWVDTRIEQGCIVPQYICDITNQVWTRVFRPGENEDVILSHLARWTCSVYRVLKEDGRLQKIRKSFFEEILHYLIHQLPSLRDELGIIFIEDREDHKLSFKDDTGEIYRFLDYMEQMYILSLESNQFYNISPYLTDEDFILYNTISAEVNEKQKALILQVIDKFRSHRIPFNAPKLMFNYYYRNEFDYSKLHRIIENLSAILNESFIDIRDAIKSGKSIFITDELKKKIYLTYAPTVYYTVSLDFSRNMLDTGELTFEEQEFIFSQKKLFQLNMIIAIMMVVYFDKDFERVKLFAEMDIQLYKYLESVAVRETLSGISKQGSLHEAFTDSHLTYALQSIINNSVLND